jgi:hypothetical protein
MSEIKATWARWGPGKRTAAILGAVFAALIVIGLVAPTDDSETTQDVAAEAPAPVEAPAEPTATPEPTAAPTAAPTATPVPEPEVDEYTREWAAEMIVINADITAAATETSDAAAQGNFAGLMLVCLDSHASVDWDRARELAAVPPDQFPPSLGMTLINAFDNWEQGFILCAQGDLEGATALIIQATADIELATAILSENL